MVQDTRKKIVEVQVDSIPSAGDSLTVKESVPCSAPHGDSVRIRILVDLRISNICNINDVSQLIDQKYFYALKTHTQV